MPSLNNYHPVLPITRNDPDFYMESENFFYMTQGEPEPDGEPDEEPEALRREKERLNSINYTPKTRKRPFRPPRIKKKSTKLSDYHIVQSSNYTQFRFKCLACPRILKLYQASIRSEELVVCDKCHLIVTPYQQVYICKASLHRNKPKTYCNRCIHKTYGILHNSKAGTKITYFTNPVVPRAENPDAVEDKNTWLTQISEFIETIKQKIVMRTFNLILLIILGIIHLFMIQKKEEQTQIIFYILMIIYGSKLFSTYSDNIFRAILILFFMVIAVTKADSIEQIMYLQHKDNIYSATLPLTDSSYIIDYIETEFQTKFYEIEKNKKSSIYYSKYDSDKIIAMVIKILELSYTKNNIKLIPIILTFAINQIQNNKIDFNLFRINLQKQLVQLSYQEVQNNYQNIYKYMMNNSSNSSINIIKIESLQNYSLEKYQIKLKPSITFGIIKIVKHLDTTQYSSNRIVNPSIEQSLDKNRHKYIHKKAQISNLNFEFRIFFILSVFIILALITTLWILKIFITGDKLRDKNTLYSLQF